MNFYGHRKSEDHQPFKFPILCIVIINQSNARQTAFKALYTIIFYDHRKNVEQLLREYGSVMPPHHSKEDSLSYSYMIIVSFSFQCYPGEFSLLCGTPDIVFRETFLVLKGKFSPGLCDYPVPLARLLG